jgi:hypothetical protein
MSETDSEFSIPQGSADIPIGGLAASRSKFPFVIWSLYWPLVKGTHANLRAGYW